MSTLQVSSLINPSKIHSFDSSWLQSIRCSSAQNIMEHNKGIIMHRIVTGYVPSTPIINFRSNQNRLPHKHIVLRPRLDIPECSLMHSGENLWNNSLLQKNLNVERLQSTPKSNPKPVTCTLLISFSQSHVPCLCHSASHMYPACVLQPVTCTLLVSFSQSHVPCLCLQPVACTLLVSFSQPYVPCLC